MLESPSPDPDLSAWLALWPETAGGRAVLINLSENHTYRVAAPGGASFILRLHRPGYQSPAAIESELAWIEALRRAGDVPVPAPVAGRDGRLVQTLADRHGVLFADQPGREPRPDEELEELFRVLGAYAARMHNHVQGFPLPPGFVRPVWDAGAILDAGGLWGDWRRAPGVAGPVRQGLAALEARLRVDLGAYGTAPDRFGLIHADMRLANVLVGGAAPRVIDFDDCGFGWFVYDLAAALSFYEHRPEAAAWRAAWLAGYRRERALAERDLAMVEPMILLRRMALLAWIGSHGETPLAQIHAPSFATDTLRLAEPYLAARALA